MTRLQAPFTTVASEFPVAPARASARSISNGFVAYSIPTGRGAIEPSFEGRAWTQVGLPTSYLGSLGVRMQLGVRGMAVAPGIGYTIGQIASQDPSAAGHSASLTGFRGTLAIRLR